MKRIIYDIALLCFPYLLKLASHFNRKARLMIEGRKNWESNLCGATLKKKRVWFHCASLGEFEQGRPLIERIRKLHPDHSIVITFFSSSGYEVRKNYAYADYICYLPFDGKAVSNRFVELLKPNLAVFVKYEFWYYYLFALKRNSIPTFLISAIFRPEQQFFKKRGTFFRSMLSCFQHFFVQNEASKELLESQEFHNITISGDTRFDRVAEICSNSREIEIAKKFKGDRKLMVVGSSWPEDMDVLLPVINNPEYDLKFIIAPHEVEGSKIRKLSLRIKSSFQLFSKADLTTVFENRILIIDSIGLLSSLYQYGDIAYIGGAFGEGLHNILEAATYGMPVIFGKGKDNHKYQEAMDLVNRGGAFEVTKTDDVRGLLLNLLENESELQRTSEICREYVRSNTGASNIIMDFFDKYL